MFLGAKGHKPREGRLPAGKEAATDISMPPAVPDFHFPLALLPLLSSSFPPSSLPPCLVPKAFNQQKEMHMQKNSKESVQTSTSDLAGGGRRLAAADMARGELAGEAGLINKHSLMFDTDDPKFNPTYRFGKCYPQHRSALTAEIYPLGWV